jgi:phosphoglycolate phosphatase
VIKLVVCDWDGTLVDSVADIAACKKELAVQNYLNPPSEETIRSVLGLKFNDAMKICFPGTTNATLKKLGDDFHTLMQEKRFQSSLFPTAQDVLRTLKKQQIKLAIATSKARIELDVALDYNGLDNIFDLTCAGDEFEGKPDPTMLRFIMHKFGFKPSECLMIGDTTIDIEFARNADMKIICVSFGAHSFEKLQLMKPDAIISCWSSFCRAMECYAHLS